MAIFVLGNVKFGQRDLEFPGGSYIYNVEKLPKKLWDFVIPWYGCRCWLGE
jgi:hypothetical protein